MKLNEEIKRIKDMIKSINEQDYSLSTIKNNNPRYDYDNRDVEPEYYDEFDDEDEDDFNNDIFSDEEDDDDETDSDMLTYPQLDYEKIGNSDKDFRTDIEKKLENGIGKIIDKNKYLNLGKKHVELPPEMVKPDIPDIPTKEKRIKKSKYKSIYDPSVSGKIIPFLLSNNVRAFKHHISPDDFETIKNIIPFYKLPPNQDPQNRISPIESIKHLNIHNEFQLEIFYYILRRRDYDPKNLKIDEKILKPLKYYLVYNDNHKGMGSNQLIYGNKYKGMGFRKSIYPTFEEFKKLVYPYTI